jgi:hypothetical protein
MKLFRLSPDGWDEAAAVPDELADENAYAFLIFEPEEWDDDCELVETSSVTFTFNLADKMVVFQRESDIIPVRGVLWFLKLLDSNDEDIPFYLLVSFFCRLHLFYSKFLDSLSSFGRSN